MSASDQIGLVWFRRDLRLDDNPAWSTATAERNAVVPLFVIDERLFDAAGPYRRRQLVANAQALDFELFRRTGGRLLVRYGDPATVVPQVAREMHAGAVYWNDDVSPFATRRDAAVRAGLDVTVQTWAGSYVLPPGSVRNERGELPQVFTSFHAQWLETPWDPWPAAGEALVFDDPGDPLPRLEAQPAFLEGTTEASARLDRFLETIDEYHEGRNLLDASGSSLISSDLRYGTLSPRQVLRAVAGATPGRLTFIRQLARRDWHAHLLAEDPALVRRPLDDAFGAMAWRDDPRHVSAWKGGFTGYPFVDAGMRELRATGWLHHRVRTVTAAFLVKDLLVDWRIGERHFRRLLIDGDVAQNVGNWQAAAGVGYESGAAKVPNPVTQSQVYDPEGDYIRTWVPELAKLSREHIHAPWLAPADVLATAGIEMGRDYPLPVVDHAEARTAFLDAHRAATARPVSVTSERVAGLVAAWSAARTAPLPDDSLEAVNH